MSTRQISARGYWIRCFAIGLAVLCSTSVNCVGDDLPVIGQPAPEIEGEDVDGVEFKLSDYRGKIVVLDFWGDW